MGLAMAVRTGPAAGGAEGGLGGSATGLVAGGGEAGDAVAEVGSELAGSDLDEVMTR
jgi:hypothetical protein